MVTLAQQAESYAFHGVALQLRAKQPEVILIVDIYSEKAMTPDSSTLAWKIPWMEEPDRLQSMWSLRVGHDWVTSLWLSCIGEGNGNPHQCSCLENPRDVGAWWAAVYGVAQSQTRLKRLSSSSSSSSSNRYIQSSCLFWNIVEATCLPYFRQKKLYKNKITTGSTYTCQLNYY